VRAEPRVQELRRENSGRAESVRPVHENVRGAAAWVIERTLSSRAPASTYFESAKARCDDRDHGLLRELVRGTLTWLRRLDDVIGSASHRDFERIERGLQAPLRLGAYQLLFLDRVPPHAVVHEAVEQARRATHKGGASFVNAVLRQIARQPSLDAWPVRERDPVRRLAIELSHPDFLVQRWWQRFGELRTRELLNANNRAKPLHLLAFRDRGGRELAAEELIDEQVELVASAFSPVGLKASSSSVLTSRAFLRGDLYVQDELSQAAALIPPPRPGESVLDLAAAPGGKTFAMIAFEPSLRLTAADRSWTRLARMRQNLERLSRSLPLVVMDGAYPALEASFDRVVLDLPCSGTGTLRKHPELKWRLSEAEMGRLSKQAGEIVRGASRLVRPGGLLVAISCSVEPEENELVMAEFLEWSSGFAPLALEAELEGALLEGVYGLGLWQMLPAADHDGFSVSVVRRENGSRH
jgi:16S rRNA (cytosine967-C5)-methyltransferase